MISQEQFKHYATDPSAFRCNLLIDVNGSVKTFGSVMDPWQAQDFTALDPLLMRSNGQVQGEAAPTRAWLERGRGHSKTTDIGVMVVWALAFANRPLRGYCFAADKDQASILKDAMETIVRLNPWLTQILEIQKGCVVNTATNHPGCGGKLEIYTSDVASSWGILPDLIVADEVCHWQGDGSLWHSLLSSAAKRSSCSLIAITNSGFVDSWQWSIREAARQDSNWYFSRLDGPQASWMTPARLAEQRKMLPEVAYLRLWENIWSSGGGDALTEADIIAAFDNDLSPMTGTEKGWSFVTGVDLSLVRDFSAVVTLGIGKPDSRYVDQIRLADARLWKPGSGQKINLQAIENYIRDLDRRFNLAAVVADPWQCEHIIQRLSYDKKARGEKKYYHNDTPWIRDLPPTGANLRAVAGLLIECFTDRRIKLYDYEPLRIDLHKLRVEEKSYGFRLVSPRDGDGHGDTATALGLALYMGHQLAGQKAIVAGSILGQLNTYENALDNLQREAARYSDDMAYRPTDHQEPIRDLFQQLRRPR